MLHARSSLGVLLVLAFLSRGLGGTVEEGEHAKRREPNRLIHEKSPYLLQHAYNPVDWYPWGQEAFEAARKSGKPIFLSIGYSTCHWCHVMERESFENEAIAAIMNEKFISIKLDREERPDVDEVYMKALLRTRGSGGWPLSAFLTADGKPFFLGSYFPPEDHPRRGRGFRTILELVAQTWTSDRETVLAAANRLASGLSQNVGPKPQKDPWELSMLKTGYQTVFNTYDEQHGGFGQPPRYAPKFPRTATIDFLLVYHRLTGEKRALDMATDTLERMYAGGVYDHVGKGFHRYSVDREWLVPHFEKMLYDNALISVTYLECYRSTGREYFLDVALDCLEYLLTRMKHPEGAFYSAEDADSEGEEGKYYVFNPQELTAILGEKDGKIFAERYGVVPGGNFEQTGKSVLHLAVPLEKIAAASDISGEDLKASLERSRQKLLEVRSKRVPPLKDDKILTDWNGLAISALSVAHQVTGRAQYLEAAERTVAFIDSELARDDRLLHRYRLGDAKYDAYFEDYAFVVGGLLDLYEASLDIHYLNEASRLAHVMIEQFWDGENGGFFQSGSGHEKLIVRTKEYYDGAIPSGNSVAANGLIRLGAYTGDAVFREKVEVISRVGAGLFQRGAQSYPKMLQAAARALAPTIDVVIVAPDGKSGAAAAAAFLREVHRHYLPSRTIVRCVAGKTAKLAATIPWLSDVRIESADAHVLARRRGADFERLESVEKLREFLDAVFPDP